jgi:hypothetical protein
MFQRNLLQRNDKLHKDRFQNNVLGYNDILHASAVLWVRTQHSLPMTHVLVAEGGSWLRIYLNSLQ